MASYTGLDGVLRLYDSTATPFYVQMVFEGMDLQAPGGRPRPEQTMIHHRGRLSSNSHYLQGNDQKITDPLDLSYTFRAPNVLATMQKLRVAHSNPDQDATWTVDGDTWVTTKGDFTLINGLGSGVADPAFDDTRMFCANVEILWTKGGVAYGFQYGAVYFPPEEQSWQEAEDSVVVSCAGKIYGLITEITAFTSGTES